MPARSLKQARHPGRPQPLGGGSRLLLLTVAGGLWAAAVAGRLVDLAVVRHAGYRAMALRQQQRAIEISPERGVITDRDGRELAVSLPVQSCFAVPQDITDIALVASQLSPILQIPERDLVAKLRTAHNFVWVARRLTPDVAARIDSLNLRGIYFQQEMERFYPEKNLAAQVLGFVDIDGNGEAGVEYQLDKQIRGRPGQLFVLADGHRRYYHRTEVPPVPGANVQLTIDQNIQYIAESRLASAVANSHALGGSILVMKPGTGEVLAMANWPTFDPNLPAESDPAARQNRAISDIYEPGSTFKTITLSAALDEGVVTPDQEFDCQMGSILLFGRLIHDWHRFGMLTVAQILMHSSDVGAIKVALKVGNENFYRYIRAFGFGRKTGIELPWESAGMLRPPRLWQASSIGSLAMGQEIGITPLQLALAESAIANGGLLYHPRIVKEIDLNGQRIIPPEPPPTRPISAATAATMRHLMEGVVLEGTGRQARLDGYTDAGKTGTAQKVDPATGRYSRNRLIASFVGYAPLNNPAAVVLVVLDSPRGLHEGGQVSAPVFKQVMEQVLDDYNVPRDLPVEPLGQRASLAKSAPKQPARRPPPVARDSAAALAAVTAVPQAPPPGMFAMPSLAGKTVRAATEECLRLGLDPVLEGSGVAVGQQPAAGAFVRPGTRVVVSFALRPALVSTKGGNGNAP
ncbi:MAG TPA: penicillin-binding protein [Candidatus Acidoferrales bacterium]|nr:penicillin-binding protein [Candidatus Acidoferrales bacterium]